MRKKDKTPKTFTFEDFERLAHREPSLEGIWIYRLTQTFYDPEMKNPYPKFELEYEIHRLFLTFNDAVKYLKENKDENIYCSWIAQVPIGHNEYRHGGEWLFDNEGNLIDFTTTYTFGDTIEASFFGRPKERHKFHKGDIVEVVRGDEVSLAVVSSDVPDVEWCWGVYQRGLKRYPDMPYGLDCTDEAATIITGPSYHYHDHVSPLRILKPRFPIPSDMEEEMRTWIERAEQESFKERKELDKRNSQL